MNKIRYSVFVLVAVFALGITGCAKKSAADKLVGAWAVDTEALVQQPEFKKMPEKQRESAVKMMKSMAATMEFDFTKDHHMTVKMMGKSHDATYKVKS